MGIRFANNLVLEGPHIQKQETATALINSAAEALRASEHMEIFTWANAVSSGAPAEEGHFLEVYKGEHQAVGIFDQTDHLTMRLKIKKKTVEENHSLCGGSFHLYVEARDPGLGENKYALIPKRLTYKSIDETIKVTDIVGATTVPSDKALTKK